MPETSIAQDDEARRGRTVLVVTAGLDIGSTIAAGLCAGGAQVAWITDSDGPPVTPLPPNVARIEASFASRSDVEKAVAQAAEALGPIRQMVHSAMPGVALESADIASLSDERWTASCRAAMKSTLYCLQAAYTQMSGCGGSVVVVGPSFSLAGAPGLIALCTAVEGQRGLVKSTARQWGRLGLTVNWIAASATALSPHFATATLPTKPDPVPLAFGRVMDLQSEIVPVIEFLGSPAGRAMTGATLLVDGGEWMVP